MKKVGLLTFTFFTLYSCSFFETEKISSETFYKEELQTFNWNDVDNYPLFKNCESFSEKETQKKCFENTITTKMHQSLGLDSLIVTHEIDTKVEVDFSVSNKGFMRIQSIKIDSVTQQLFPFLKTHIIKSIDSIQLIAPAYKRGIPVQTSFTLPILIKT